MTSRRGLWHRNRKENASVHRMAPGRRRLTAEALEPRLVLDSTVVFNELMYNPPATSSDPEWIELYNQLAVDMDISEWRLDGGVDYTFPDGTIVPGRGFVLISATDVIPGAQAGVEVLGPFTGSLSNGGEDVYLYNNDGRLMNTIEYGDSGFWPVEPDGSGATLAKYGELTASEDVGNWTASPQVGGTPGSSNFFSSDLGQGVSGLTMIVPEGEPVSVLVPANGGLGNTWTQPSFNDVTWTTGDAGVGYERSTNGDYDSHINLDVLSTMNSVNESIFIRLEFNATVDAADIEELYLQMKYDDGFVAYLNGSEVARANAPTTVSWDSGATSTHNDGEAVTFVDFDISANKNLLVNGANVLAIHGLNSGLNSSDFLISPRVGYIEATGGGGGNGSDFSPSPLVINEISPLPDNKFVELANNGTSAVDLAGLVLHGTGELGGDYTFGAQSLAPGAHLVLTEADLGYTLSDNERLFLYADAGQEVLDGQRISGRLRGRSENGRWLYPDVATAGAVNSFDFQTDIVINEIMYHHQPVLATATTPFADSPEEWIELYNKGDTPVDLGLWELRDAVRYTFPAGTELGAGEYLVVARDPVALAAEFPDIDILGPFDGSLSNTTERIELRDSFSNPADEVKYYESGQWDSRADGGGSSLELKNPDADNANGAAWAASDESSKSDWHSYSHSKVSTEPLGISQVFHELVFGMLESGEVLIDNISLRRSGSTVEHVPFGDFESIAVGATPAGWRLIGNHGGSVIVDPEDSDNKVLYLNAAGAQQNIHDHVEVSFASGQTIRDGSTYTLSFDAKWLGGSRQLNHRLYFTRAANTMVLEAPQDNGTPGAQNSQYESNVGPTYTEFIHAPLIPSPNQPVTVTVQAEDPDGVSAMVLFHRVDTGGWSQVPMTLTNGTYSGEIPGRTAGQVVQFYVQGTDALGAVSTFPQAGSESRALYQVDDGQGSSRPIESFRIVLTSADNSQMFSDEDRMTNNYLGGTLIVGEHTVFYDAQIRQVGSRWVRPNSGYKVKFGSDNRYHGVHESIRFDINSLGEILMKQMVNRAAGSEVSMYDDISYMVSQRHGGRIMLLNLARYESTYLKEQFGPDGTDGTKFELDDITFPTDPSGPNNEKVGTGVSPQDMRYRGADPEAYRGHLLIKNNRAKGDYDTIAEFSRVLNLSGTAFATQIHDVMDVDLWMRHYATQAFVGNWDTYGFRRPKNLRIFIRPDDGLVIPLFWDADLGNYTDNLIYNGSETRLDEIRNIPSNERLFWGHMLDLTNRSFNSSYTSYWNSHYASLGVSTASDSTIATRWATARAQALVAIPSVDFEIQTNGGNAITTAENSVDLVGEGWIDVREVYLVGQDEPLAVTWTDDNSWLIEGLPVSPGQNTLTLQAYDFEGNLIATDAIDVTSTSVIQPLRDVLRVSEIHYHPADPTTAELAIVPDATDASFEFIEFTNTGDTTIDLDGVQITSPVQYTFGPTNLPSGGRVVVARDVASFDARYAGAPTVGAWGTGTLPNAGGAVTVLGPSGETIQSFVYDDQDNWPSWSDGNGNSLEIIATDGDYNDPLNWLPSFDLGGTPGVDGRAGESSFGIRITELNYNPPIGVGAEFIEIVNEGNAELSLSLFQLVEGVEFNFASSAIPTLQPGESVLVVGSVADFESVYGTGYPIAGTFSGALSNGGERIVLMDLLGNVVHDFVYDDATPWYPSTDGGGYSLEVVLTSGDYSSATNWQPSTVVGGTPERGGQLACDYVGNGDGCDMADIDALYAGTDGAPTPLTDALIAEWLTQASDSANPLKPTPTTVFGMGDVNLDGVVDSSDLGLLLNSYNRTDSPSWGSGNLNADDQVDSIDLGLLLNRFGFTSPTFAAPMAIAVAQQSSDASPTGSDSVALRSQEIEEPDAADLLLDGTSLPVPPDGSRSVVDYTFAEWNSEEDDESEEKDAFGLPLLLP